MDQGPQLEGCCRTHRPFDVKGPGLGIARAHGSTRCGRAAVLGMQAAVNWTNGPTAYRAREGTGRSPSRLGSALAV